MKAGCICAGSIVLALAARAAAPFGLANYEGTIKEALGVPREFFARQRQLVEERRGEWLKMAEAARPVLHERIVRPVRLVTPKADPQAFLGWRFEDAGDPQSAFRRPLKPGDTFYFDFGEHMTARFSFRLGRFAKYVDAPPRLRFVFGEIPAEAILPCEDKGNLSRSWHQDETVTVDAVPSATEIPRRLAFRYVKVTVEASSRYSDFSLDGVEARAFTSADESRLVPFKGSPEDAAIDRVGVMTLRDCMQTVLEDGPKRDRRLWLGDLRLQAKLNYLTYRNYDVVKRSMLLLAGTCGTNGLVSTAVYEIPKPETCHSKILDFTAHFPNVVLEYLEATGDRATCESLWPLVVEQADFTLEGIKADGLMRTDFSWWQFIDWQPAMTRQAAEQGVIVNSLRATAELGRRLGHEQDVAFIPAVIDKMTTAAQERLWDDRRGVWVSEKGNVSWMSQAWMALSGIATREQARRSLQAVMSDPDTIRPVTPYARHYFLEALCGCGLTDEALRQVRDYWGGMVKLGADTYWEAWVPDDWEKSPYGNVLLNSFCHAFSSTPGYFLRKYAQDSATIAGGVSASPPRHVSCRGCEAEGRPLSRRSSGIPPQGCRR